MPSGCMKCVCLPEERSYFMSELAETPLLPEDKITMYMNLLLLLFDLNADNITH